MLGRPSLSAKSALVRKETEALYDEGATLCKAFQSDPETSFRYEYQAWYTKAVKAITVLAPDRAPEFREYYEIDPKRKALGYGTYVIQDFFKGVRPAYGEFDTNKQTLICFFNQITIFKSILDRIDSVLANIEGELYAELQDSEILMAKQLLKVSPRAAGALVGTLIEGHLQKVAAAHQVLVGKKNPTIADLNDPLRAASVIDMPTWRKITYLADLRNLCSHKKDVDPTKGQAEELVQGAEWLTKNVSQLGTAPWLKTRLSLATGSAVVDRARTTSFAECGNAPSCRNSPSSARRPASQWMKNRCWSVSFKAGHNDGALGDVGHKFLRSMRYLCQQLRQVSPRSNAKIMPHNYIKVIRTCW